MTFKTLSLKFRIFLSMLFLVLFASILIASITIYQYKKEADEYHTKRLTRKEDAVKNHIKYILQNTTYEVKTDKIQFIFKDVISELASIHNLEINMFSFSGVLLSSSERDIFEPKKKHTLSKNIISKINESPDKHYVERFRDNDNQIYQSSYLYINDIKAKPLFILNLPVLQNNDRIDENLEEFLINLAIVYSLMLLLAIGLAYFLSNYITSSLQKISSKLNETRFDKKIQKIELDQMNDEIYSLVNSYNNMVDELEKSAVKLAKSEREQAWREMAKQVAHEIKNPLTPMRLTVQSFQRRFDPKDENIKTKLDEFSKTLIQQIDTMSSIASAFSNFAKMPTQQNEKLNVVEVVELAIDIFTEDDILFTKSNDKIIANLDRTQLIRIITNLVKNAKQASDLERKNTISVSVTEDDNNVIIKVSDTGTGITTENRDKIFEPKFTTKNSGMGLGLAMIKQIIENYKGTINFESVENFGTTFTVILPKG